MQRRGVRLTIFALLVVTAGAGAFVAGNAHVRAGAAQAVERDVDARLDRMSAATAAFGAAQQGYVAPGQQRGDAMTRASVLVQQIYDDIASLRRAAASAEAGPALLTFGQSMDALVNVDDRVRDHLRFEQDLMAADLVYTEARQALEAMAAQLEILREAERSHLELDRALNLTREASAAVGAVVILILGAFVLVRVPPLPVAEMPSVEAPAAAASAPEPKMNRADVDLAAAAHVCSELSRTSSASGLPATLARAARVLDAPGLVVWLGAGDELFPAMGHGYGQLSLARLGPIARSADNATAATWRSGALSVVPGSSGVNGAIVAPLQNQSGCFGVLAAEVRHGRERDLPTQAVATMMAAQLSAVVAPWPAGSGSGESDASAGLHLSPASGDEPTAERTAASA